MHDIKAGIRGFIRDNFVMGADAVPIGDTDSFMDLGILDSTGLLELVAHLEETFGIKVEDVEMLPENLDSLAALEAYLGRKGVAVGA